MTHARQCAFPVPASAPPVVVVKGLKASYPAGQSLQTLVAFTSVNLPSWQFLHLPKPVSFAYSPGVHLAQEGGAAVLLVLK